METKKRMYHLSWFKPFLLIFIHCSYAKQDKTDQFRLQIFHLFDVLRDLNNITAIGEFIYGMNHMIIKREDFAMIFRPLLLYNSYITNVTL